MNRAQYKDFIARNEASNKLRKAEEQQYQMAQSNINAYEFGTFAYSGEEAIKEQDNIYVNIVFDHDPTDYSAIPIGAPKGEIDTVADYSVTKTVPILDKASDYYCSVIRFTIPLDNIPLLIAPIVPNTNNLALSNNTIMVINIFFGGIFYTSNVLYEPTLLNFPVVLQNQSVQVVTPYYYIFTYQKLINMFNNTLSVLWIASGLAALFPGILAPYYIFDPVTTLISIIVPKCFTKITAPAIEIPKLSQNIPATNYMNNFLLLFNGVDQPNGNDLTYDFSGILPAPYAPEVNYPPPEFTYPVPFTPATTNYYKFTQDYPSIPYWSSVRRLILTSNIPINPESITSNTENATLNILSDFIIDTSLPGASRSIAYYNPNPQYRLIDLNSDTPLQKLNIRIFWQDDQGNIYPLGLTVLQQASLKLLFVRKSLYKNIPKGLTK